MSRAPHLAAKLVDSGVEYGIPGAPAMAMSTPQSLHTMLMEVPSALKITTRPAAAINERFALLLLERR